MLLGDLLILLLPITIASSLLLINETIMGRESVGEFFVSSVLFVMTIKCYSNLIVQIYKSYKIKVSWLPLVFLLGIFIGEMVSMVLLVFNDY